MFILARSSTVHYGTGPKTYVYIWYKRATTKKKGQQLKNTQRRNTSVTFSSACVQHVGPINNVVFFQLVHILYFKETDSISY